MIEGIIVGIGCLLALILNVWYIKIEAKETNVPIDPFDVVGALLFACGSWITAIVIGSMIYKKKKKS